ncbi:MAG: phenylalanine--tRNA ligase subunit beta, partial [Puniceicoccales bacterium]|nr:phenylalanine--tRNA ligase subunit beta [Puniceicoccales bacterium]
AENGILILDAKWPIGTALKEIFPEEDAVLDIAITANRGDCLGHLGIARELSAYFDIPLSEDPYAANTLDFTADAGEDFLLDELCLESDLCTRFTAWSVRDIRVGPSPQWLRRDIERVGMRSVNNVVDITNWVMLDCGQPLHAFDAKKVRGKKLHIRLARDGETICTLNHKTYELRSNMLVLADTQPLVIAGIMGSVDAEVDDSTTDIILESAFFSPASIQLTARKLGLQTDASQRFARGTDRWALEFCARRAIKMFVEICGGRACSRPQVAGTCPEKIAQEIVLGGDFLRKRFGSPVRDEQIAAILQRLHFSLAPCDGGWRVGVPYFRRNDVKCSIDLVEEFGRLHGIDHLGESSISFHPNVLLDAPTYIFQSKAAQTLGNRGFSECYSYSTVSSSDVQRFFDGEVSGCLRLANPLSADQTHLRASLIPGLLRSLDENLRNGNGVNRLFEIGRVWQPIDGTLHELIAVSWLSATESLVCDWHPYERLDFYSTKALACQLSQLAQLTFLDSEFVLLQNSLLWQDGHGACVNKLNDGYDLHIGLLHMKGTAAFGIGVPLLAGELRIAPKIFSDELLCARYVPFSNFPKVLRNLSVSVDARIPAEQVRMNLERCVRETLPAEIIVGEVKIFDVYQGKAVGSHEKSIAVSFTMAHGERTLTEQESVDFFSAIVDRVESCAWLSVRRI